MFAALVSATCAANEAGPVLLVWGTKLEDSALWLANARRLISQEGYDTTIFAPEPMAELTDGEVQAGCVAHLRHCH